MRKAAFSHNIERLCHQMFVGETATVTGWGTTSSGGALSDTLLEVDVNVISNEVCV